MGAACWEPPENSGPVVRAAEVGPLATSRHAQHWPTVTRAQTLRALSDPATSTPRSCHPVRCRATWTVCGDEPSLMPQPCPSSGLPRACALPLRPSMRRLMDTPPPLTSLHASVYFAFLPGPLGYKAATQGHWGHTRPTGNPHAAGGLPCRTSVLSQGLGKRQHEAQNYLGKLPPGQGWG